MWAVKDRVEERCLQISEMVGQSDLEYVWSHLCGGEQRQMAREREKSSQSCSIFEGMGSGGIGGAEEEELAGQVSCGRTCRRQRRRASAVCVRRSRRGSPRSSFRRVREVGGTRKVYERERSRADYRRVVWAGWERRARCEGKWTVTRPCQRRKRRVADRVRTDWSLSRRDACPFQILKMIIILWSWKERVGSSMTPM